MIARQLRTISAALRRIRNELSFTDAEMEMLDPGIIAGAETFVTQCSEADFGALDKREVTNYCLLLIAETCVDRVKWDKS